MEDKIHETISEVIWQCVSVFSAYLLIQTAVSMAVSVVLSYRRWRRLRWKESSRTLCPFATGGGEAAAAIHAIVLISGALTLFLYWLFFRLCKKRLQQECCATRLESGAIFPLLLAGISFNVVISLVIGIIPFPQSWIDSYTMNSASVTAGNVLINWAATVLMAPVLEEVVFRGLVYTRLKQGMPRAVAAILTSLLFGLMHGTIIWGLYTFAFSLLLIWVFEEFGSLKANILLHMSFNLMGMLLETIDSPEGALLWAADAFPCGADRIGGLDREDRKEKCDLNGNPT